MQYEFQSTKISPHINICSKSYIYQSISLIFQFGFLILIGELLREKSAKLKLFLTVFGMPTKVHILTWTLYSLVQSTFLAVSSFLVLKFFSFALVENVPWWFWLVYLITIGFSTNIFALLISSLVTTGKQGFAISYFVLLFGFVFQVFFTNPNTITIFYGWVLMN